MTKHISKVPCMHDSVRIADSAKIIGDVTIEAHSSVWFGAVIRGDVQSIHIGEESNIQDLVCIHVGHQFPTKIGNKVTVGHGAILHSCQVEDNCIIGMGSILLDGCHISENSIVGAGALVTGNKKFEPGVLILGNPAKSVRALTSQEIEEIDKSAINYRRLTNEYL